MSLPQRTKPGSLAVIVIGVVLMLFLVGGCITSPLSGPTGSQNQQGNRADPTDPVDQPRPLEYSVNPRSNSSPDGTFLGAMVLENDGAFARLWVWVPAGTDVGRVQVEGQSVMIVLIPIVDENWGPAHSVTLTLHRELPDELHPRFVNTAGEELSIVLRPEDAEERVHEEVAPGAAVTYASLQGFDAGDGVVSLAWRCDFSEGQWLNVKHDAIISGAVMVNAVTGAVYHPELSLNLPYPGLTVVPDVGGFLGMTDDNMLLTRDSSQGPVYAVSADGTATAVDHVPAYHPVENWVLNESEQNREHEVVIETQPAGEFGPILRRLVIRRKVDGQEFDATPPVDGANLVGLVVVSWQWYPHNGEEQALFFVTEQPGPSYGDWWTHYQLWEYRLASGQLIRHTTLPTSHFFIFEPGNVVAFEQGSGIMVKELADSPLGE